MKKLIMMVVVALLVVIGIVGYSVNMDHKVDAKDNITVQEFVWNGETDYTSIGKVFKVVNVNNSEDYVWLDQSLLDKDNVKIIEGDTVKVTFNHDDAVKVKKIERM